MMVRDSAASVSMRMRVGHSHSAGVPRLAKASICVWNSGDSSGSSAWVSSFLNVSRSGLLAKPPVLTFLVVNARTGGLAKRPERDTFKKLITQALLQDESPEFQTQIDTLAKRGIPAEWEWPTRIRIDTHSAESRTIIEVESADRLGLLHRISKVLTRHGLSIHVARISTEKGAAIDTFYVRTALGKKPTDEALLRQTQSDLETELSEQKRDTDFTD